MTDILKFRDDVESFLKDEGFNIFPYRNSNLSELLSEIEWADTDNWRDFFSIAKKEGITTIFEEIGQFSDEDLQSIFESNAEDDFENKTYENISEEFKIHKDKIHSVSFSWIKNNIRHTISEQSSWMKELLKKIHNDEKQKQSSQLENKHESFHDRYEEDVPEHFIGKEEEIAKKFLDHIKVEHPNVTRTEMWTIKQEFWQTLGINNYSNKQRIFTNKISAIVDKIIAQEERNIMPDLIEKCVKWAIENKIDKPTQTILRGYLAENNINLTPNNFKILHTKVILKLKSSG